MKREVVAAVLEARPTIHVCVTCTREGEPAAEGPCGGRRLYDVLAARAGATADGPRIAAVRCLANCRSGCTVALSAPEKWTYVFGAIDPEAAGIAEALMECARLQSLSEDGRISYFSRPETLRRSPVARIPPITYASEV